MAPPENFKPALIIVDLQEDFCPPNGSLAVPNGRDIIPTVNSLLNLPFALKIATKDWHPSDHISFAANHPGKQPFSDFATIINPNNPEEKYDSRLWPVHCVQNTPGAELISELDVGKVDKVIEKGQQKEVEMYSAFYDPLKSPRCSDSGLAKVLREERVTDVYCVGLAFDYCVKATAVDAGKEGFRTWVVREGTRGVDAEGWERVEGELKGEGVSCVDFGGEEVGWVRG
ncbi:related to pyrazinamidase/nicotinamidase [Phialocephala subalpina]|uniref:nicotinamidase n=1 Tax=Phialocephala subalpina TaxID=576137 RepID=A0A1L7WR62_9HELO|nr:related to pyrazinamidase/nicotinamidase [Phialocephala subalpina]